MTGPAEIAAQCSPKTSVSKRSTVSPVTATSVYSVTLPSGSRTTSAMARLLPRKPSPPRRPSPPSLQDEVDRQPHAERPRLQSGGERHAAEPAHGRQRLGVEQRVRGGPDDGGAVDLAARRHPHLELHPAADAATPS